LIKQIVFITVAFMQKQLYINTRVINIHGFQFPCLERASFVIV